MNVSGPCFVIVKNGVPFNKYEVNATVNSPIGCWTTTSYYFDKKEEAETFYLYLLQEEGEKEIDKLLKSDRTFLWEKAEYREFKKSINWQELRDKVKKIHYTKIVTVTKIKRNNDEC